MRLDGVSEEVANRILTTQLIVQILTQPGSSLSVKEVAERLGLETRRVRELMQSDDFYEMCRRQTDRMTQRILAKGMGRIEEIIDDNLNQKLVLDAIKTACTVFKTITEYAPQQEADDGVKAVEDLRKSLRDSQVRIEVLAQDAENDSSKREVGSGEAGTTVPDDEGWDPTS